MPFPPPPPVKAASLATLKAPYRSCRNNTLGLCHTATGVMAWEQQDEKEYPTGSGTYCHGSMGKRLELRVEGRLQGRRERPLAMPEAVQALSATQVQTCTLVNRGQGNTCQSVREWETHAPYPFLSYTGYSKQKSCICFYTIS